jgi:hypothetical protein
MNSPMRPAPLAQTIEEDTRQCLSYDLRRCEGCNGNNGRYATI